MKRLILESWLLLLYFEFVMRFGGLKQLSNVIRRQSVTSVSLGQVHSSMELCRAVDFACVFYFKAVLCLQRSAATVLLLRRYGWDAEMVIGAQVVPFKSHAWVEVNGVVANDKPYMSEIYRVLNRC